MLWKHVDPDTGAEVRRQRRFVVSAHATVANYEYLIYWRFYQDGSIEREVRATGIMVSTPMAQDGDTSATGTTVDRRSYAPFHQHSWSPASTSTSTATPTPSSSRTLMPAPITAENPLPDLHTAATVVESEAHSGRSYPGSASAPGR